MDLKQVAHCNALDIGFVWNLTLLRMMSHHTTGEKDLSASNVAELTLLPCTVVKKKLGQGPKFTLFVCQPMLKTANLGHY